ncbi:MAG: hypothetical protein HYX89_05075 [Chloroflexi bacterium]|nr:hypothetical protein [Chloroflexota bacterium]
MRLRRLWLLIALLGAAALAAVLVSFIPARDRGVPPDLSWEKLRNAAYPSEFPKSKVAQLADGVYEEEYVPGAATKLVVQMADVRGSGLLDQDETVDAAVILVSSPGGSGVFIYLVAVLNRDGEPDPVAPVLLGDRVAVRGVRIEDHKITVRMRVRGPDVPFAYLTHEVTRTYNLTGNQLVLESETEEDVPSVPAEEFSYNPERIERAIGAGPTKVEGLLKPGQIAHYVVRGEAGQKLVLSLRSEFKNAVLSAYGLDDETQLVSRTEFATDWSGVLLASQDYALKVITVAGYDLKYTLTIQLLPPTPTPTSVATPTPTLTPTVVSTAGPTKIPITTPTPAPTQPSPSETPASIPQLFHGDLRLSEQPLAELSPDASEFLQSRAPAWGVAIIIPSHGTIYAANPDEQLEMASVVKVLILLEVLDQAAQEHRYVDEAELHLLWPMITESDNDSATKLWNQVGGGPAINNYLRRIGVSGIAPYNGPYWGTSIASARSISLVFAKLAFGDILDEPSRKLALTLLQRVIPSQRWGVSSAAEGQASHRDAVGLKDGWYPDDAGWRVNSAGFIVPSSGDEPSYTIAVMTNRQPTWNYGKATIGEVASRIHAALHGDQRHSPS